MNETLKHIESGSNFPELESDFEMQDALATGDFTEVLNSRIRSFESAIFENKQKLVSYLTEFMATHEDSVFKTFNLESVKTSGLDMEKLSNLVSKLSTAQMAFVRYVIDLKFYVKNNYPERMLEGTLLEGLELDVANKTLIGDELSRLYPNLNRFMNSNLEEFLSAEQKIQLAESFSRVARLDLQASLDEMIEMKLENVLSDTFRAIEWRGNYPYTKVLGHSVTINDFLNSDLGKDLRSVVRSQLIKGYDCEPIVQMTEEYNAKDSLTPYKRYKISFRVTNGVDTKSTTVIDAENYYHPFIHGDLKGDMNIAFLQRMDDVDMNYQVSLSEVPEWNGKLSNVVGVPSASLRNDDVLALDDVVLPLRALMKEEDMKIYLQGFLPLEPLDQDRVNKAIESLLASDNQELKTYALHVKSILNKRYLYEDALRMLGDSNSSLSTEERVEQIRAKVAEIESALDSETGATLQEDSEDNDVLEQEYSQDYDSDDESLDAEDRGGELDDLDDEADFNEGSKEDLYEFAEQDTDDELSEDFEADELQELDDDSRG